MFNSANTLKKLWVLLLLTSMTLAVTARPNWSGELPGSISVSNESKEEVYVMIGGRNQGFVDAGYTETFRVPLGEFKVEAQGDKETAYRWLTVSRSYPNASWTVYAEDLE